MEDYGVAKGYIELDTKDLESNVKSAVKALDDLERKGALAESELNKLESQSQDTGNAFQQAEARAKTLTSQIEHAQKQCGLYESEIKALNTVIDQARKKQAEEAENIKKATAEKEKAEQKVVSLSSAYKAATKEIGAATKKYGENSQEVQDLTAKHEKLIQSYNRATSKVKESENTLTQSKNQWEAYGIEIEQSGDKIVEFQTKLNNTQAYINRMTTELVQAKSAAVQWGQHMQDVGDKLQGWGSKLNGWGNTLSLAVTAPLTAAGTYAVKTAMDFESAFTGVTKTVDATTEELDSLRQGIIDMSKEIPSSTTEISAVAEAAGQLGIQTPNILGFTRTMIDLGNATNLSAEEGAASLAQFANVTGMSQEKFSNLGSTIVDLGNNFATTEADIVSMGSRLVGAGAQVGMTEPQILGFATALSSVGIEAEAGGTAFSTLMSNMQLAVETGGESLTQFAEVSGMSAEQFQQAFRDDAAGAILAFVDGLSTCEERGMSAISVLDEMGLSDVRMRDALLRAAGASDVFTQAIATGTTAWEENTALTNEAEKRYGTTASQIEIAKNRMADSARVIGEQIMPVVADVMDGVADLAEKFGELDPEMQQTIITSAAVAAGMGPVLKVTGSTLKGVGSLADVFGTLLEKAGKVKKVGDVAETVADVGTQAVSTTSKLGGFSGILSKIGSPFGIAAIATTAIIGIGAAMKKAKKEAEKADLEEHFGDIVLSAEEVEDIAERLTTTDWTMRVDAVIDAKDKLKELQSDIESTIETMEKTEWKIGVGLELTEEEKSAYQQSVTDYISGVQSYIEQQQYTASLAVNAIFEPGSALNANFQQSSSEFYNALNGELTALGEELAELVNQAWEDNVLSDEELDLIDDKRTEIQKKLDEIAQAEYDLELSDIQADATKDGLSADSFSELQSALSEKLDEKDAEIEDVKRELLLPYQIQYNNSKISLEEFDDIKEEVDLYAEQQFGELVVDNVNLEIGTIKGDYSDKIGDSMNDFSEQINEGLKVAGKGLNANWTQIMSNIIDGFSNGSETLTGEARTNVEKYLDAMKPEVAQLEEIAQTYKDAGLLVPQNVNEGLMDYYELEAMTGNTSHMWEVVAGQIAESPELQEAVAAAQEAGMTLPKEVAATLQDNYGLIYNASEGMFQEIIPNADMIAAVKAQLSDTGMEAVGGVIYALATKAPDVQAQAIQLLTQLQSADESERPAILAQFSSLGPDVSASIVAGFAQDNIYGKLNEESKTAVQGFISGFSGLDAETQAAWSQAWYGALAGLEGFEDLADPAEAGVDAFLESLADALEVHSPSQAVKRIFAQAWPGAAAGLDEGQEELTTKGSGVVDMFLGALTSSLAGKMGPLQLLFGGAGTAGFTAFQQGLTSEDLNPPDVNSIDDTSYTLGQSGNVRMGLGLTARVLSAPSLKDINNAAKGIGQSGNAQMGIGLQVSNLNPPNVNDLDVSSKASKARNEMQSFFDNNPLSVMVNVVKNGVSAIGDALGFANGGIATEPAIFGEDGPEMAIPLSQEKRTRALALYEQTGELLGVTAKESAVRQEILSDFAATLRIENGNRSGDIVFNAPGIDYDLLADKVAERMGDVFRKAPVQPVIEMKDGDVYLDNERTGRKLAPVISRIMAQDT